MRRRRRTIVMVLVAAVVAVIAGCSDGAKIAEMNAQATKATAGVDEKNLEQALKMEQATDELNRMHDAVEEPMARPPEDLPSR